MGTRQYNGRLAIHAYYTLFLFFTGTLLTNGIDPTKKAGINIAPCFHNISKI